MIEQEIEAYELFRRAIVLRDEEAWELVYAHYRLLLIAWARRTGAAEEVGETCADIADQAWGRAWSALTPERFADFPTLARLLSYLRACVTTTAIDMMRMHGSAERRFCSLDIDIADRPQRDPLDALDRSEIWRIAFGVLATSIERVTLIESFVYCLSPRAIQARHPQLFPNIADVYRAKRNLLERLQRNHALQRLNADLIAE
jgi:DNA-directed RNA polymerase specialized sigma24 family protein